MEAEATGIERRAAALSQNQEAVIAQQIAENLPEIVRAAASSFEHVGNFTVLNGAEGVTGALAEIIQQAGALSVMAREALIAAGGGRQWHRSERQRREAGPWGADGHAGEGGRGAGEARCSDRRVEWLRRGPQGAIGRDGVDGFLGGRAARRGDDPLTSERAAAGGDGAAAGAPERSPGPA